MSHSLLAAAGLGAATGLRSMTGIAMASLELADRGTGDRLQQWLAEDTVSYVLSAIALGEIVADKLPDVPDRIEPASLAVRGALGATIGAIAAGEDHWWAGAAIGAVASVTASWIGWAVRKEAGWATGLPDPILAVLEDAVAVASARGSSKLL